MYAFCRIYIFLCLRNEWPPLHNVCIRKSDTILRLCALELQQEPKLCLKMINKCHRFFYNQYIFSQKNSSRHHLHHINIIYYISNHVFKRDETNGAVLFKVGQARHDQRSACTRQICLPSPRIYIHFSKTLRIIYATAAI